MPGVRRQWQEGKKEESMFGIGFPELVVLTTLASLVAYYKIFSKAGFSRWLCFTMIVPILNIAVLFYLAFAKWPLHDELDRLKGKLEDAGKPPQKPGEAGMKPEPVAFTKRCPECAELIQEAARRCKHCGTVFAPANPA